jgi:bifunctional DNA-binding transcriptional regulator/antitoxin component of YhaV-PrlF toxin-antitoxin module
MMYTVGPRGQILLSREVRDKLSIEPGTRIVQMVVGDHVELHFVRPEVKKKPAASPHGFLLQHRELKAPEPTPADIERAARKRRAAMVVQGKVAIAGAS